MGIFDGKKKNWMIVLHKFHVDSYGFKHEILCDASQKEADAYALVKAKEWKDDNIPTVSATAIELPDLVQVVYQNKK